MKVMVINGSPRKQWNTYRMLKSAEQGAKDAGAETEFINLYDLSFTDCKSCFACKVKGNKTNGVCAVADDVKAVYQSAIQADGIIIGSPIYFGNLTGETVSFINRLLFPVMRYELDAQGKTVVTLEKKKQCALVVTMNAPEEYFANVYKPVFEGMSQTIGRIMGDCELVHACDTYQFNDYSRYYAAMWDESKKAKQRGEQFPLDLKKAYDVGYRIGHSEEAGE